MFERLKAYFTGRSDDRDARAKEESARMLEMDEPMAGAGGMLAGDDRKSETEDALQRAAKKPTRN